MLPYYGGNYPHVTFRPTIPPEKEDDPVTRSGMTRRGGCARCGACCEAMIIPLDPRMLQSPKLGDWIQWAELHGCRILTDKDQGWFDLWVPNGCRELRYDGSCGLMFDGTPVPERPDMCARYPQGQEELVGVEHVCTYHFEGANNGNVE